MNRKLEAIFLGFWDTLCHSVVLWMFEGNFCLPEEAVFQIWRFKCYLMVASTVLLVLLY